MAENIKKQLKGSALYFLNFFNLEKVSRQFFVQKKIFAEIPFFVAKINGQEQSLNGTEFEFFFWKFFFLIIVF